MNTLRARRDLIPVLSEDLTPEQFQRLTPEQMDRIERTQFVPPVIGSDGFGRVRVFYKQPVYKQPATPSARRVHERRSLFAGAL